MIHLWCELVAHLPFAWAQYAFMQQALLAVLLVTPLFALLGCLAIDNQMAFFADAIGHANLAGIALGLLLGVTDPTWSTLGFALLLAVGIMLLRRREGVPRDTPIAMVMAMAMAIGIVLLSRGGGFARQTRFLVGDILTVTPAELGRLALTLLLVAALWGWLFNRLLLTFLNRSLARSRGVAVWRVETLFALLVAAVVALCMPWVGLLTINALLIVPAAAARNVARGATRYVALALLFSLTAGVAGLLASFYWGTASGATMVLAAMVIYLATLAAGRGRSASRARSRPAGP